MPINSEQATLNIEKLKEMVASLGPLPASPNDPLAHFYMSFPKIEYKSPEFPMFVPHSMLWGPIIADPMKFACVVDASMVPDARPPKYTLRQILRKYGYKTYAQVRRWRRENRSRSYGN